MEEMLKSNGEVILAAYDCYWWGRQTFGQGLSMDYVIHKIARICHWLKYAMSTGIKYYNICSEYWHYKLESEYKDGERISGETD